MSGDSFEKKEVSEEPKEITFDEAIQKTLAIINSQLRGHPLELQYTIKFNGKW